MDYKNENKNAVMVDQPITDYTHLIDLPPVKGVLDQKVKGSHLNHPKAEFRNLTVFFHKNGLSNLL
ncbi:hypothetical protein [Pedobacter sp. KLB.chiD]|uniref:hypothetical protein n=1 Tax=Pedobacter sp. KLB.chiD TaxID=3387402 RepID=UPI003999C470